MPVLKFEKFFGKWGLKKLLIMVCIILCLIRFQYSMLISSQSNRYQVAEDLRKQKINELNKTKIEFGLTTKKTAALYKRNVKAVMGHHQVNLSMLLNKYLLCVNKNIVGNHRKKMINISAHTRFLEFYNFLIECQLSNILIESFFLQKKSEDELFVILNMLSFCY